MLLETISAPIRKALDANSTAPGFTPLAMLSINPSTGYTDTVFPAGHGGIYAPNRLFLLPFAEGNAGATFSFRVYGWRGLGEPDNDPLRMVWISYLLAEFSCATGNLFGPPPDGQGPSRRWIKDSECMADTISLSQGSLGIGGLVNSTGPGTDLGAYALLDLAGSKYFQFDFQQADPVGMNLLWARA